MAEGSFDWCSFFALFWNDKGIKCKINIPDTVLFRYGQLSAWWATSRQEGYVQRHASHNATLESIRRRFIQVANEDEANYSKFVAICRANDGRAQLLRLQAFNQLVELLSDRLEAGQPNASPEVETPQVLQAFIQPHQDLRYVTTYINQGATSVTCHTFQRKFSRRYSPNPAAPGAASGTGGPGVDGLLEPLALIAAGMDETPDPATGQGAVDPVLKMEFRKLTSHLVKYIERAHNLTLAGLVCEWIRDAAGKVYLLSVLRTEWASNSGGHGAGSLAAANLTQEPHDADHLDDETDHQVDLSDMPPPPPVPSLDPEMAWQAMEGVSGGGSGPQRPGSSLAMAAGDGLDASPSGAALAAQASSMRVRRSASAALIEQYAAAEASSAGGGGSLLVQRPSLVAMANGSSRPGSAFPGGPSVNDVLRPPGVAGVGAGTTRSGLSQFPGGSRSGNLAVAVSNTWPSAQHDAQLASPTTGTPVMLSQGGSGAPGSPTHAFQSVLTHSRSGGLPSGYGGSASVGASPADKVNALIAQRSNGRLNSARAVTYASPMAERQGSGSIVVRPPRPGSSPVAFGRNTNVSPQRPAHAWSPSGPGTALPQPAERTGSPPRVRPNGTGHVNAGVRGAPAMMQQLTKELEQLREQLLFQNQMAEASAAKVRQLEREKELLLGTYDQRTSELQGALLVARQDLAASRAEADEQRRRADEAEARAALLETRASSLQGTLDAERTTVMTTLRECHERDSNVKQRAEQLEVEVLRLTERLKEETTAGNALKRQLLQFSDIAERFKSLHREGEFETGMQEVLDKVAKLFDGQANPFGEQYAVQKILHHYHTDLRAVFLYYAQLENNFAAYWPPGMAFQQWMLFCKETETSDPRASSRLSPITTPHKMLHPRDCEAVFRAYAKMDPNAINTSAPVLTYEGFLAAIIDISFRVKRPDNPYLSEAIREYVLRYIARANKMSPNGLRKGQVRDALEGTKDARPGSAGPSGAPVATRRKKSLVDKVRTTTGTAAGGSLAASRPQSAISRKSLAAGSIDADLAMAMAGKL